MKIQITLKRPSMAGTSEIFGVFLDYHSLVNCAKMAEQIDLDFFWNTPRPMLDRWFTVS